MSKYSQMPRDTVTLLSKKATGRICNEDYIDWAVHALEDGFDSPSLIALACLDSKLDFHVDAGKYFEKTIKELALPIPECELLVPTWPLSIDGFSRREIESLPPNYEEILYQHLDEIVEQIKDGLLDPVTGVNRIHLEVVDSLSHPAVLMEWCFLWESISSEEGRGTEEETRRIIQLAEDWLKRPKTEHGS